jgi:hypothetical protein
MRKENSLFDKVVSYINSVPVGKTYKVADMLDATSPGARKIKKTLWNRDPFYRNRSYQTMLKNCNFIENVSRGEWRVLKHIPLWFSTRHAQIITGWAGTNEDRRQILNDLANELEYVDVPVAIDWGRLAGNSSISESYESLKKEIDNYDGPVHFDTKKKKKKKSAKMSASYNKLYEKLDKIHHDMMAINSNLRELIEIYK